MKLGFIYAIDKPTNLYIQDLNIHTQNANGHLDIKIIIPVAEKKISQFINSNTTNIYTKDNYM
jgi:hypothetical protein